MTDRLPGDDEADRATPSSDPWATPSEARESQPGADGASASSPGDPDGPGDAGASSSPPAQPEASATEPGYPYLPNHPPISPPPARPPKIERAGQLLYWLAGLGALWALMGAVGTLDTDALVRDAVAKDPTLTEDQARTAVVILRVFLILAAGIAVAIFVPLGRAVRRGSGTARVLATVAVSIGMAIELLTLLGGDVIGIGVAIAALAISVTVLRALWSAESTEYIEQTRLAGPR